jgi:allophanate hydrolase subunit 1
MPEGKMSSISKSRTLEEMADFWDTHSLADYAEQTHEVEMTFDPAARRTVVSIEPELMADISEVAQKRRVSSQTLINVWLRQQVDRAVSVTTNAQP